MVLLEHLPAQGIGSGADGHRHHLVGGAAGRLKDALHGLGDGLGQLRLEGVDARLQVLDLGVLVERVGVEAGLLEDGRIALVLETQREVRRVYNEDYAVEGVDVRAAAPEGDGEVRVMGLLSDGDIYILAAWNNAGGLDEDPEMTLFFDSFQPFVE